MSSDININSSSPLGEAVGIGTTKDILAIRVSNLSKRYEIYDSPRDRLKQFFAHSLHRLTGKLPKQYFREFWALKDVSLEVKIGQTVGIIGRNGSGKSTLLQTICGTLSPSSGTVQTVGRLAALLELGSGFNPEFTGRENVYMNASVLGLSAKEINERFDDIVEFADIGEFIEQPVKTYSSGMLVRLAFAVIAHIDANILVIDEALAVGDVFFTQKCMRFLREFMQNGTVIFVSHDTASIKSLCTHVIWLEHGHVIQCGSPKEVCESYLEASYESQQGKSTHKGKVISSHEHAEPQYEEQPHSPSKSEQAKDIQISKFNNNSASFGNGAAKISGVYLLDENEKSLTWIAGGETVILKIEAHVHQQLHSPIAGFFIKDRLGQMLFGDNSYLNYKLTPVNCNVDDVLRAAFSFKMPLLPAGNYTVTVAIANGTQLDHEQLDWIHDALTFRSESSRVCNGLIGIPMLDMRLEVVHSSA